MSSDKHSLMRKAKAKQTSKAQQCIHSPLAMGRHVECVQPSPGAQNPIPGIRDLGRKMPSLQTHPASSSPTLYAEHDVICSGIPLWSGGVSCPGCPLPIICAPAVSLLEG